MREKAVWLTEGVTLSGVQKGMSSAYGHTLESLLMSAEGVRVKY